MCEIGLPVSLPTAQWVRSKPETSALYFMCAVLHKTGGYKMDLWSRVEAKFVQ